MVVGYRVRDRRPATQDYVPLYEVRLHVVAVAHIRQEARPLEVDVMNRRGFLGSVLGAVAGTPFLARLVDEPVQRVVLPDWRMAFREESGLLLQAPGVARVERTATGLKFVAETLDVSHAMTLTKVELRNKHNHLIAVHDFRCRYPVMNGDKFNCECLITAPDFMVEHLMNSKPLFA